MTDERAQLRTDLEAGRWQRLTDPLLLLALFEDPSWWADARQRCMVRMTVECLESGLMRPESPAERRLTRVTDNTGHLRRMIDRMPAPRLDMLAAVEVCERWPAES